MAKRRSDGKGQLPDWHLWHEVRQTVAPLRPPRRPFVDLEAEPLPLPAAPLPKPHRLMPVMPPYQSDGRPARKPRAGIEPNLKQRLQRGRVEIDGTIDLHGMRQVEAHAALTRFIHARAARGDRTLLVITGKGLKKLGDDAAVIIERGVLRAMLPIWLSEPNLAPLVAGWDVAAQGHGGDGAFYVRLRRERDYR
ncbi:MAG: Smr/MutS family protein [Devosia sp.]|uniref:Smr/MutS family protein n=1 Tax=Devosia sp. TaxID=1871048 RepID=UPI001AC2D834|nr:Smr/MutS family protein [Devosia sp.]MBN9315946.1 Smr/MutS family protein [Devosia sp.]